MELKLDKEWFEKRIEMEGDCDVTAGIDMAAQSKSVQRRIILQNGGSIANSTPKCINCSHCDSTPDDWKNWLCLIDDTICLSRNNEGQCEEFREDFLGKEISNA